MLYQEFTENLTLEEIILKDCRVTQQVFVLRYIYSVIFKNIYYKCVRIIIERLAITLGFIVTVKLEKNTIVANRPLAYFFTQF